jgi:hypothetical protein
LTTIFIWDMSHFDAPAVGTALAEGISAITHKAGGDSNSGDPELAPWWSGVKTTDPAKTLLGTYWVPRPDLYPSPVSEANRWIATLDARCPGWRNRPHMLQMDAERWPAGDKTKPGRAYLQALGDQLVELVPKLRPICYASKGQYGDELKGLTFPLWNARYPTDAAGGFKALYARVGGDTGLGWASYSGKTPVIWQYSSKAVIGGQSTSDANAFRGTLAELTSLVAPGWEDDVSKQDVTAALGEFFARGTQKDGTPTSQIGRDALDQGIPSPWAGGTRENAWKVIGATGAAVRALQQTQAAVLAQLATLAGKDFVDEPAIAAAVLAGLTPERLAAALAAAGLPPDAIAAAIPDDLAQQVVLALGVRLSRNVEASEAA